MSLPIEIRPRAKIDLARQYRWYLVNANEEVATRYWYAFSALVTQVASHPALGNLSSFSVHSLVGVRSIPFSPPFEAYLVFYKASAETLQILRVIHGARDLPRRLREEAASYATAQVGG